MVLDIDAFKAVNDRHGHAHGDFVLQRTATATYEHIPPPTITARTGGEEFAVVTLTAPKAAIEQAAALQAFLARPTHPDVTLSVGVAHADTSRLAEDFDQICIHADAAIYAAKQVGGDTIFIHDAGQAPGKR